MNFMANKLKVIKCSKDLFAIYLFTKVLFRINCQTHRVLIEYWDYYLCHYDGHWWLHGRLLQQFYCSLGQTCYLSSYCFYCYHYDKYCWVGLSESKCFHRWTMKSGKYIKKWIRRRIPPFPYIGERLIRLLAYYCYCYSNQYNKTRHEHWTPLSLREM